MKTLLPSAPPVGATTSRADAPGDAVTGTISTAIVAADDEDQILGLQLEIQWDRALRGEAETHIFGAMMIALRLNLSTRGQVSGGRGKKGGVEDWLRTHAPKVRHATAYRWARATEGLLKRTGIADAAALQRLLGTDADDLPEPERAQQMELFATLEKSTQAELIDAAPIRPRGGKTYERDGVKGLRHKTSAAETLAEHRAVVLMVAKNLNYIFKSNAYVAIRDEAELDGLLDHLEAVTEKVRAWKALTKERRAEAIAELVND